MAVSGQYHIGDGYGYAVNIGDDCSGGYYFGNDFYSMASASE